VRRRRPRVGSDDRRRDHHGGDADRRSADADHRSADAVHRGADAVHGGAAHLRGSVHHGGRDDDRASFDRARLDDAGIDR
jgi:hypothetical protein